MKPFSAFFGGLKNRAVEISGPVREMISRRTNDWLVGAMGAFILLNTVLILIPMLKGFYDASTRTGVIKRDIGQIEADRANEAGLVADRNGKKKELEVKERQLAVGDISLYLETFAAIAEETEVRIKSVRPEAVPAPLQGAARDAKKSDVFYEGAYFEISAAGGYHDIGRFIQKIETYPTFVKVIRVAITSEPETPTEQNAKILIKMVTRAVEAKDEPTEKS